MERFLRAINCIQGRDRLVKVRSWMPVWDGRFVCWPTMQVDCINHYATVSPCWDRVRIRLLAKKAFGMMR